MKISFAPVRRSAAAFLICVSAVASAPAAAQGLLGQITEYATVDLHTGRALDNGVRLSLLRVEMKPGWKTYWRNPGDTGIPPHFDWTGSSNLKSVSIAWPTPIVFDTYGSRTIGYEQRMALPLTMTAEDPAKPIDIKLSFSYGLCSDICIPAQQDIALSIPPGAPEDGGYFIDRAFAATPVSSDEAGMTLETCKVEGAGESRMFRAAFTVSSPFVSAPVVVAEGPEGVWFGPTELSVQDGVIIAEGPVETDADRWIDRSELSLTLLGQERAITHKGCATSG